MAKIKQIFILSILLVFNCYSQTLKTGAEQINEYYHLIKNKKIALVANQSSIIKNTHLLDTLISLNLNVVKVFTPEHGFRGQSDAGELIESKYDLKTKIPLISLYGKNKKPSKQQLKDIDIIIFDIQDVGARFYTYISTLHYILESASENNKEIIILDRPNPNGHYIDGPVLDTNYKSFVGMHPIPIVHGMTIGEYAKMIIGEKWISKNCNLTIIKMKNYNHKMKYDLPVNPSPNLKSLKAVNLYPSLCLFEGTSISVGRGTTTPFQHFGAPYLNSNYSFIPKSMKGSKNPKYENIKCYGTDLRFQDVYYKEIVLDWIINAYNECPKKDSFFNSFFNKLAGNNKLKHQIINGMKSEDIKKTWEKDLKIFKEKRRKYLLYIL